MANGALGSFLGSFAIFANLMVLATLSEPY